MGCLYFELEEFARRPDQQALLRREGERELASPSLRTLFQGVSLNLSRAVVGAGASRRKFMRNTHMPDCEVCLFLCVNADQHRPKARPLGEVVKLDRLSGYLRSHGRHNSLTSMHRVRDLLLQQPKTRPPSKIW